MTDIRGLLRDKFFIIGLLAKIGVLCFFAGSLFLNNFLPFIDYFVGSGFRNPYDFFYTLGQRSAFPYSSVMLWITSLPYVLISGAGSLWLKVGAIKIALLVADFAIMRVLFQWFPVYKKKILLYYWLSPVLFFISYVYGQFDVIPTAIVFLSFYCLSVKRYVRASVLLGVGIATKTHVLLLAPFLLLYFINKQVGWRRLLLYSSTIAGVAGLLLIPYATSIGYKALVLQNTEQIKIFSLFLDYGINNLKFFLIPGVFCVLLLWFRFESKMSMDYLIAFSSLLFGLLVVLVPPQLGRYYWSLPFMLYFYIKYDSVPKTSLLALYIAYFSFFALGNNSDFMTIFSLIDPSLADISLNALLFSRETGVVVQNILFTILTIATAVTLIGVYKSGFMDNKKYDNKQLLIGIGGDSGAGKSTLVNSLISLFRDDIITLVEGDDIHRRPRGHENWKTISHLHPKGNNLHLDLLHAKLLKLGDTVERRHYDHGTGQFTDPQKIMASKYLVFAGLHPFFLEQMREIIDLKIFVKPDEDLRLHWKIIRDMKERGYTKEKVQEQLKTREHDSAKYIQPQEKYADVVVRYSSLHPIVTIGDPAEVITLKVSLEISNSYYLEPIISELLKIETLEITHSLHDDLEKQVCEFVGKVNSEQLHEVLSVVVPDYYVLTQKEIVFAPDLDGLIQIFLLYIKYHSLHKDIDFLAFHKNRYSYMKAV